MAQGTGVVGEGQGTAVPSLEAAAPEPHLPLSASRALGQSDAPRPGACRPPSEERAQGGCPPRCCCEAGGELAARIFPRPAAGPGRELRGALASLSGHALAGRRGGSSGLGAEPRRGAAPRGRLWPYLTSVVCGSSL